MELKAAGIAALRDALNAVGLSARVERSGDRRVDLVVELVSGDVVLIEVNAAAIPTHGQISGIESADHTVTVFVADQLSAAQRAEIESRDAGWFDRRGHLRLVTDGVFVDTDVAPAPRRPGADETGDPVAGRSGLAAAVALLLRSDDAPGPSAIARRSGLNQSSISRAMGRLVDHHLADRTGRGRYRPLVPELFWALAAVWPRESVAVRWKGPIGESDPLGLWRHDQEPGCALAGVRGAVAWGASLVATADYPLRVYAPSAEMIRQIQLVNEGGEGVEVHLALDPVGFVTAERFAAIDHRWRVAHPLFCALDLTAASRDREALAEWNPPEGFVRVW